MGRPGPKKKARMSRTRSDFLTRCNSEGATQSDDDDEYYIPAHSCTLPPSLSPPHSHSDADCHSDSEMVKYRVCGGHLTSVRVTCPLRSPSLPSSHVHLATRQGDEPFNTANPTFSFSTLSDQKHVSLLNMAALFVFFLSADKGHLVL